MIKQHVTRTIIFGIIGLLIGIAIAAFSPKIYEGRTEMVVGVQNDSNQVLTTLNEDVRAIIQKGLNSNVATELQILRGKSLFFDALRRVAGDKPEIWDNRDRYYAMYDVLGDKESNAALVQARMYDPETSARLANSVADAYNETRQASARKSVNTALDYLKVQAAEAEKLVKKNEEELRRFKQEKNIPDLQGKTQQLYTYHTQVKASLDSSVAAQGANEAQINQLQAQLARFPEKSVGSEMTAKRGEVTQLEQDLQAQRTRLSAIRAQYEEDSTEVRQAKETAWDIESRLNAAKKKGGGMESSVTTVAKDQTHAEIQQALNAAMSQRPAIAQQVQKWTSVLASNEAELASLPTIERDLVDRGRELSISESNLKQLKSQEATLQNRGLIVPAAASVLYPAVPDKDPVAPDPAKMAFVGLAGGLAFGLLFSLGLESLRARLYSSQQLADLTGLPVVATVPLMPRPAASRMLQGLGRKDGPLIESLRFLAFSSAAKPGEAMRRVLFTSNSDSSGCSTAAGQYAAAIARTGVRVLLVDGNLRQPTLSRVFAADSKSGVSDVLSRNLLPSDQSLVLDTEQPNLRILPAGSADENSIKEVSSANLAAFLDSLATYADIVVIDTPPCNIMADASRLAPYADEVFLVVSAASASARNVPAAYEILSRSGAKKVSLIMTHASPTEESFSRQADYLLSRS